MHLPIIPTSISPSLFFPSAKTTSTSTHQYLYHGDARKDHTVQVSYLLLPHHLSCTCNSNLFSTKFCHDLGLLLASVSLHSSVSCCCRLLRQDLSTGYWIFRRQSGRRTLGLCCWAIWTSGRKFHAWVVHFSCNLSNPCFLFLWKSPCFLFLFPISFFFPLVCSWRNVNCKWWEDCVY